MDLVILEQFLHSLPENTRVWVRKHQPNTLEAAIKLSEEFLEADFPRKEVQPPRGPEPGRRGSKLKSPKKKREEAKEILSENSMLSTWKARIYKRGLIQNGIRVCTIL